MWLSDLVTMKVIGISMGKRLLFGSEHQLWYNRFWAVTRHDGWSVTLFIVRVFWALPYTLLGLLIGSVGLCFGGRVRVHGRVIEFYDGGTKWLIQRFPRGQFILAMTLGHTILGQTAASLDIARKHELVHVAQYERWGPFMLPAYILASMFMWATGRRFYRDNPFEREAYDVAGGEHDP